MTNINTQEKTVISPLIIKAEKIVSALYMVVSYIDQNDPIVPQLKRAGLGLLESLYETKSEYPVNQSLSFETSYHALTALIRISKVSEIMSAMNADILLRNLAILEQDTCEDATRTFVLSQDFFETPTHPVMLEKTIVSNNVEKIPQQNPRVHEKTEHTKSVQLPVFESQKKELVSPLTKEISTGKKLDLALKLSRRNTLLKLTKDKGSISIKECMSVIHDCSEKTIQRELTALVDQKILKKTGDKRWSRYSLA